MLKVFTNVDSSPGSVEHGSEEAGQPALEQPSLLQALHQLHLLHQALHHSYHVNNLI
jgi:hypothetical protein